MDSNNANLRYLIFDEIVEYGPMAIFPIRGEYVMGRLVSN
jgi:hypothetical protein